MEDWKGVLALIFAAQDDDPDDQEDDEEDDQDDDQEC